MEIAMIVLELAVEAALITACITKWLCKGPYDG